MHYKQLDSALAAYRRGFTPIPILEQGKKALMPGWSKAHYATEEELESTFDKWAEKGCTNVSVLLGEPSSGLIDVDIDHPKAARLKDFFLPRTGAVSGRAGARSSHYWYRVEGELPATRQYKLPDGSMAIELRSTGGQTVIPPSVHPSGEEIIWEGEEWGGADGPEVVDGARLNLQVAIIGLSAALLSVWPQQGSRHETYLALAGALLDDAGQVHGFWERNAGMLIRVLAEVTADDDGPESREAETIPSTIRSIRQGQNVVGFGKLGELIGEQETRHIRRLIYEVEAAAGYAERRQRDFRVEERRHLELDGAAGLRDRHQPHSGSLDAEEVVEVVESEAEVDPMEERRNSWDSVNLLPYLTGTVQEAQPSLMTRTDGAALLYPGTVNMIYGSSESAKTWIALHVCTQIIGQGGRVAYVDFEDDPVRTIARLLRMGAHRDDIASGFSYIHPEEALAPMQRNRWGKAETTDRGLKALDIFEEILDRHDPELLVLDGMTALYGLHGLNTNDTSDTDVITTWMRGLVQGRRRTVLVVDHAAKHAEKGTLPIGSQHKVSMVQGTLLQAWPTAQPMPGKRGEVELIVLKDRPGQVRARALEPDGKSQVAAKVVIDSATDPARTVIAIQPPKPEPPVLDTETGQMRVNLEGYVSREEKRRIDLGKWGKPVAEELLRVFGGDMELRLKKSDFEAALPDRDWRRELRPVLDELSNPSGLFGGQLVDSDGINKGRRYYLVAHLA